MYSSYPPPLLSYIPGSADAPAATAATSVTTPLELIAEPRAAATIAQITGKRIEVVLWQLRELEQAGLVTHETDEAGVMRWVRT